MTTDLSVVIPTKQEAACLPRLLESVKRQGDLVREIIVADAHSTDTTRDIAASYGCTVIDGGLPSTGRNLGARASGGNTLLFLDADVVLPDGYLKRSLAEFSERHLACSTSEYVPISERKIDHVIMRGYNAFARLTQRIAPMAGGFCIFATRDVFDKTGGFNDRIRLGEDFEFVERCTQHGEFGILHTALLYDVRRFEKEGRWNLARKYTTGFMHRRMYGEMYELPFDYVYQGDVNARDAPVEK